ncbi:MAG: response regulator transcription factor [Bacillati bacterium ANGP1]|uniref:Response regulator transcription factor n=1 Tax=Candidatus Segetimicrobium genomatis TaxID=2569760 RepID=A0A537JCX9_9BACT|nr:MAG: response regulator transcription factor [Terrabacteria group bacterium ANGP1]
MSGQQALEGNGATVGSTMSDQGTTGSRLLTQAVDVKVLAADAHPVTLLGLQYVLQSDPSLQLVGSCGTGAQALELCASLRPSLLITDVTLPDMSGIELCRTVKRSAPDMDVLILTACDDNASIFGAVGAGVSGYVLKDITPENLLRAIHAVRRGQTMVHPGIARRMLDRLTHITQDGNGGLLFGEKLTEREAEILAEVARGLSNKEIAHKLFISESTVKSRLRSIFSKIDARDRAQAAAFAIRRGYVR